MSDLISIADFSKVEIKVGLVVEASNQEGSEKLIKLTVNVGEEKPRTIFTAVRPFGYTPGYFANKKFIFITNLEPKKIMDDYSEGMIMAADGGEKPIFLIPIEDTPVGSRIR